MGLAQAGKNHQQTILRLWFWAKKPRRIDMKNVSTKVILAVACAWGVSISNAALMPLGGEYPLLGNIEGHQANPHVAVDSDGGFVVWQNATQSNGERILVQRLNSDYVGVGAVLQVSQGAAGSNEVNPRAAMRSDGGGALVWEAGPRGNSDVYVRFINAQGNFTSGTVMANSFAASIQRDASVAALENGGVVVVWESVGQDGSGEGIYGQRFNAQGIRVGSEFLVNQSTATNQSDPSVTALNGGKFVVGWLSQTQNGRNSSGAANLRNNVMGRLYDVNGAAVGNEYRLNDGDVMAAEPQLATRPDGGFLLAWVQKDEANTRNSTDVYIKTFDGNGLPAAQAARHNTYLTGRQSTPEVAMVGNDALVTWATAGQDAGGLGVQGRMLSGGTEFQINSQGQLNQSMPTIGSDGAGKYIAVWVNTIKSDHSILSAQRYLVPNGNVGEGIVDVTAGEVRVVGAELERRRTNASAANNTSAEPGAVFGGQDSTVSMNIATPAPVTMAKPVPVVASVAPETYQSANPTDVALVRNEPGRTAQSANAPTIQSPRMNQAATLALQNSARAQAQAQPRRLDFRNPNRSSQSINASRNIMLQRAQQSRPSYANTQMASIRTGMMNRNYPSSSTGSRAAWSQRGTSIRPQAPGRMSTRQQPQQPSRATNPAFEQRSVGSNTQPSSASQRFAGIRENAQASAQLARDIGNRAVPASVVRNGRGSRLTWISQSGANYQVQFSNDKQSWRNLGTTRNGQRTGFDSMSVNNGGHRFLRVVRTN
tara:strand:+ start:1270 stop:3570 length:2301 start_codon:yes stop_codon:yes gene_type:complete